MYSSTAVSYPAMTVLLFAYTTIFLLSSANARDISEITYHFTTCSTSGREGPSFQQCQNYYKSTNSLIALQNVLNDNPEEQRYIGGQGFVFPRSGLYSITIAGAAGGRGLCSLQGGYGTVLKGQVHIEKGINDSYMILVGQRGVSPCDTNSSYDLCLNPPTTYDEARSCSNSLPQITTFGGGGGGGGSMIWAQNDSRQYSKAVLPLVAAAGGGGTSLKLNYSHIYDLERVPIQNRSLEMYYIDWINGQPVEEDGLNMGYAGSVGNKPKDISAGFGSGWVIPDGINIEIEEVNGNLLSQAMDFSKGGNDCSDNVPFVNVSGGFGGGGGACSDGGGGGGYGGGWVIIPGGPTIPGRGGYSRNIELNGEVLDGNNGDGYVKIFPMDCGCSSEECLIDGNTFECQCPVGRLAGNGFNCITDIDTTSQNLTVVDNADITISGALFRASLIPFDVVYLIHDARVILGTTPLVKRQVMSDEQESSCVVVLINEKGKPVLTSTTIRGSNGESEQLIVISNGSLSSPVSSLENGQMVAGVIPFSESDCTVTLLSIGAEIGYSSNTSVMLNLSEILSESTSTFGAIVSNLLTDQPTIVPSSIQVARPSSRSLPATPTFLSMSMSVSPSVQGPPSSEVQNSVVIIVVGTVGVLFLVLILVLTLLISVIIYYRKRHSHKSVYQVHSRQNPYTTRPRRGGTLQRIRSKFMSLTSNPNYGQAEIGIEGEDYIDLTPQKQVDGGGSTAETANGYDSLSYSSSTKPARLHGRGGSWKDSAKPFRLRSKSKRRSYTLKPKFGVMGPVIDFYDFNSKRPEDDTWEYDRAQLTYLRDIGEGQFGKVLLMKAKNIAGFSGKLPVAVKTLSSIDDEDVKKFMDEVELMKKFCHSNIVSLLGVNSSEGAPLMILEYMPYGDLQNFLKRHIPKENEASLIGVYHHKKFARDVAMALQFLSSNKYVHRDVAARNCLVGPSLEVKLADFGMAREIHEKEYYRIAGRAVLPVRWMAPESLLYGLFSSSSDVWSYGVLLWEIVSYGNMPLESLSSQDIVEMAQMQTLSHPWPTDVCEELMAIKDRCHDFEHEKRITFEEIVELSCSACVGGNKV